MTKRSITWLSIFVWTAFVFFAVRSARGDALTAVAPVGAPDWWLIGAIAVIVAAAVGWYEYRKHHPTQAAVYQADAQAELAKALADLRSWLSTKLATPPAAPAAPAPGTVTVQKTADLGADTKAFLDAWNAAPPA
jgi:hypothetical protein